MRASRLWRLLPSEPRRARQSGQPPTPSSVPLPCSTGCATLRKCINSDADLQSQPLLTTEWSESLYTGSWASSPVPPANGHLCVSSPGVPSATLCVHRFIGLYD
ncbi:unnamed protein product [Rangifer tarandus platyrhynchus]|uniref:Uncharacterized protein n=2 Tax=Rangifer tarandus platyrhynchus TaxID=3082113 RepID=A0ABN8YED1_RANTA|nr:unnamed protein product [Rangifer tarandus platyrhynchus]